MLRTLSLQQNTNSSRLADLLLSWLGASMSLVHVTCVTKAQHSLLSMEVQRKKGSAVGSHRQLVLVCDFMMFKAQ